MCPFLEFPFRECVVNNVLWIASLHKLSFKCGYFKCLLPMF